MVFRALTARASRLGSRLRRLPGRATSSTRSSPEALAQRLSVSASTLDRWIRQGRIPVRMDGRECCYDERQLTEWLKTHGLLPPPVEAPTELDSLCRCIERGGVHHLEPAPDIEQVLWQSANRLPVPEPRVLFELLVERERLASTGLGRGIAVPHPRSPLEGIAPAPTIGVFYPTEPIRMGAIDGQPVFALFVLLSPTVRLHLQVLSRLAYCLKDDDFIGFLHSRPGRAALCTRLEDLDSSLANRAVGR